MTPDLDALAALLAAATPGPWRPCTHLEQGNQCDCGFYGEISSESADVLVAQMGPCQFSHRHEDGCGADMIPVAPESQRQANGQLIVAAVNALPALIEAARREAAARFVAEHWRDSCMERIDVEGSQWAIATHPLAMVLAALDGETEPRQLGLPESVDEAFRALLHDNAGAALPAEGTEERVP